MQIQNIGALGTRSVALYYDTEESKKDARAQGEKRAPHFF